MNNNEAKELMELKQNFILKVLDIHSAKSAAYSNIIMVAGYAAFFAVWKGLADTIPTEEKIYSVLFMILSCGVFVFWEVYKMVAAPLHLNTSRKLVGEAQTIEAFNEAHIELKIKEESYNSRNHKLWIFILLPAICLALIAIFFLLKGSLAALQAL